VIRAGRAAAGVATIFGIRSAAEHQTPWDAIAVFAIAVVAGIVYWSVTRWRVDGGELQIDTGLVRRQQVRVPLTRIQGIDLVRPLLARAVGVSELRLVLAGHGTGSARLAYLHEDQAVAVRAQLLALAHGLDHATPEPAERPILSVASSTLVASYLISPRLVLGSLLVTGSVIVMVLYPKQLVPTVGPVLAIFAIFLLGVARQAAAEWDMQIAEAPDGLRLRSGLLQTRAETVPHGRVQAIRWVEPLWWRPFGWVRLEFDVARRRNADPTEEQSAMTSKALLPVGSRAEARYLLGHVMPGATGELPPAAGVPARAVWRVPLKRRFARVYVDESYIACCHGRVRPDTVIVPLHKIQSMRWSQGPWSRRLRLGSVLVDTAGQRFTGSARFRDETEARELLARLADLAHAARSRTTC
ncbi:MAG: PH domain-containing protein, partial [Frankiaceae bacterium]|nr:PH domain-containing protein [Frankiaceae bacterium]